MPNTRITKQKWKDHFSYSKKVYVIGMIMAVAATSLMFAVTRYTSPNERAVLIELVDSYTDTTKLDADVPALLAAGQAYDESLEEVSFYSIAYSGDGNDDYYGAQVYMVQIYAGDNDIYLQNEMLTQGLIDEGYCVALETIEGFEAFTKKYPDVKILWQTEPKEEAEATDEEAEAAVPAEPEVLHAYAIDISSLTGMAERGAFSVKEKYAIVAYASKNVETSFYVLTEMFEVFAASDAAAAQ